MSKRAEGLGAIWGHEQERAAVARAAHAGQLPNALLLHGPRGIGKQRFALWLGQYLLCAAPGATEPCGACAACRLCLRLEHPDLHWFFPLPRPRVSGGSDRLGEALEDARAEELASRRREPHQPSLTGEPVGIYLAHVQVLRRLAQTRPAAASRKVFVVGDAEQLVPQEASPEAANALLKILEEPPPDTFLLLTAADPDELLPTIRSRLLPIRLRPLPHEEVAEFLTSVIGASVEDAAAAARLGQGSIGRALAFLGSGRAPGPLDEVRRAALALLDAALGSDSAGFAAALGQAPAGARGAEFTNTLEMLTLWLRDLAAAGSDAGELIVNGDHDEWLRETLRRHPSAGPSAAAALGWVEQAGRLSQLNVNPQLTTSWLLRRLRRDLAGRG